MPAIEIGRICVKLIGREAGRKCVIVDIMDKNFVMVTGPKDVTGVRRRRSNVDHLEPLPDGIDIERGASDDEVTKSLKDAGKVDDMKKKIKPALSSI